MTFFVVFHPEGCGQSKSNCLPIQELGKKTGPAMLKNSTSANRRTERRERMVLKVRKVVGIKFGGISLCGCHGLSGLFYDTLIKEIALQSFFFVYFR